MCTSASRLHSPLSFSMPGQHGSIVGAYTANVSGTSGHLLSDMQVPIGDLSSAFKLSIPS